MTTREFIQHLLLNADLDDDVVIDVRIPEDTQTGRFVSITPTHVTKIEYDDKPITLIEGRIKD